MNAFIHHFTFEFRTGIRNKQLLLMNYLFPLGFYLMMGFIMAEINPLFRKDIIPAMVVFGILAATFLGIPDPLVNARENGVFRSYKINGIPSISIHSGFDDDSASDDRGSANHITAPLFLTLHCQ